MSLSTEPSIHLCGEGFQGTAFPVLGSFASNAAAVYMNGTEQEAATADQISTLGAVM